MHKLGEGQRERKRRAGGESNGALHGEPEREGRSRGTLAGPGM